MSRGPSRWRQRWLPVLDTVEQVLQTTAEGFNQQVGVVQMSAFGESGNDAGRSGRKRVRRRARRRKVKLAKPEKPEQVDLSELSIAERLLLDDAGTLGDKSNPEIISHDENSSSSWESFSEEISVSSDEDDRASDPVALPEPPGKENWDRSLWEFRDFVDGIQTASAEGHYERAAGYIESYYKDFFCHQTDGVDEVLVELMESVEERLKAQIAEQGQKALKDRDADRIERFAALLSGVGEQSQGLELYRHFPAVLLKREAEDNMERLAAYLRHVKRQQERLHDLQQLEARQRSRDLRLKVLREDRVAKVERMRHESAEATADERPDSVGVAEPMTVTVYGDDGQPVKTTLAAASSSLVTEEERDLVEEIAAERRAADGEAARLAKEDAADPGQQNALDFVGAVTALYESAATMVEGRRHFVVDNFGEDSVDELVVSFFREADQHASRLLRMFMDAMEVQDTLSRAVDHQSLMQESDHEGQDTRVLDPRELTLLLDQMCMLSQCQVLFDRFVAARPNAEALSKLWPAQERGAGALVREILQFYNVLEEFFMMESLRKALAIDVPVSREMLARLNLTPTDSEASDSPSDADDPEARDAGLVSGVIDNTFFVLKQCCQRALSTMDATSSASVMNLMATTLSLDFKSAMEKALADYWDGTSRHICDPLIVLNNCDLAVQYCERLRTRLMEDVKSVFASDSTAVEKITLCLSEVDNVAVSLETEVIGPHLNLLFDQVRSRVAVLLQHAGPAICTYAIDEEKYADREVNDPYTVQLKQGLVNILSRARESLSTRNYAGLMLIVLQFVSKCLEEDIKQKKFSLWGGLQLSREITSLRSYFAESVGPVSPGVCRRSLGFDSKAASDPRSGGVRFVFQRVAETAIVLSADGVSEIAELVQEHCPAARSASDPPISQQLTWVLRPAEVMRISVLRNDFAREEVHRLLGQYQELSAVSASPLLTRSNNVPLDETEPAVDEDGYATTARGWFSAGAQLASQYWGTSVDQKAEQEPVERLPAAQTPVANASSTLAGQPSFFVPGTGTQPVSVIGDQGASQTPSLAEGNLASVQVAASSTASASHSTSRVPGQPDFFVPNATAAAAPSRIDQSTVSGSNAALNSPGADSLGPAPWDLPAHQPAQALPPALEAPGQPEFYVPSAPLSETALGQPGNTRQIEPASAAAAANLNQAQPVGVPTTASLSSAVAPLSGPAPWDVPATAQNSASTLPSNSGPGPAPWDLPVAQMAGQPDFFVPSTPNLAPAQNQIVSGSALRDASVASTPAGDVPGQVISGPAPWDTPIASTPAAVSGPVESGPAPWDTPIASSSAANPSQPVSGPAPWDLPQAHSSGSVESFSSTGPISKPPGQPNFFVPSPAAAPAIPSNLFGQPATLQGSQSSEQTVSSAQPATPPTRPADVPADLFRPTEATDLAGMPAFFS